MATKERLHTLVDHIPENQIPAAVRLLEALVDKAACDNDKQYTLEELRNAIQEGASSGPGIPADEVFERLEKKYLALVGKNSR